MSEETSKTEDLRKQKILKMVGDVSKMYDSNPRSKRFTALLLGETGSGKSFLARTCPKPIHIDCFDPGTAVNLETEIKKGEIIADIQWEEEDSEKPWAFAHWEKTMKERIDSGYFNYFGTYILDSSTTWSEALMNNVLKKAGIAGQAPRWAHDYVPQKVKIQSWVKRLMSLPCIFIMTGHLEGIKDDVEGTMIYRYMTTGKAVVTVPLLFDEVYVMDPKRTSKGTEYRILTNSSGKHIARSRLAKNGLLDTYEKPDIRNILRKAKKDIPDKPLFDLEGAK